MNGVHASQQSSRNCSGFAVVVVAAVVVNVVVAVVLVALAVVVVIVAAPAPAPAPAPAALAVAVADVRCCVWLCFVVDVAVAEQDPTLAPEPSSLH